MLEIIHSIPKECVQCGSDNIWGRDLAEQGLGNTLICQSCSKIMILPEEDDEEIVPSVEVCPHCSCVDTLMEYGNEEVCQECGLDPTVLDYPSESIAHLWKEGSTIRRALEKGRGRAGGNVGTFFRNFCGPHCSLSDNCAQSSAQMRICYGESKSEILKIIAPHLIQPEDFMSRKRRKKKGGGNKKNSQNTNKVESLFTCAANGWYEKYTKESMRESNETICEEGHSDTGGRSGTA